MPVSNTDKDALLKKRSLVKVVRDWRSFVATIDGTQKTPQEKPLLRLVGHQPHTYKYDADGVYPDKKPNKVITEAYKTIKSLYSRAQSTTVISPGEGVNPPTFKGLGLDNIRVGVRFDAEDPDMVAIKKIYMSDTGTVLAWHRNFADPAAAMKAKKKLTSSNALFSNLEAFLTIAKKDSYPPMNEALARLRWRLRPSAQICIFEDNLASRLLAQVRAGDLHRHLLILAKDNPELKPEEDYAVPISFYIPENYTKKIWHYNTDEQASDRLKAESKKTSSAEHMLALFIEISQGTPAFSNAEDATIKPNLEPLLKIANQLTFSSAYPFYLRIKPILSTIDKDDPQLNDYSFRHLIFNCIPTDRSQEELNALIEIFPTLRADLELSYLKAELNRFLLKPGTILPQENKDFLTQLIKKHYHPAFWFLKDILVSASIRGHFPLVELIVDTTDIRNFGNSPYEALDSAVHNKHKHVEDLIFNQLTNFDPTNTLEPFNQYLLSMLENMNARLLDAGMEDDLQLQQFFQAYQTSIKAKISPKNCFNEAEKTRTELLKMLLYIESYAENKCLIRINNSNNNSICETFLRKSAQTWDPKKAIIPPKKKTPINFNVLRDNIETLAICLLIALFITIFAAILLTAPKLALGLIFIIKTCSIIFAGSFVISTLFAFGEELMKPCLRAISRIGLFASLTQKSKDMLNQNLVQALENNIRREKDNTPNINNVPVPDNAPVPAARKDTIVLDIAPTPAEEAPPSGVVFA